MKRFATRKVIASLTLLLVHVSLLGCITRVQTVYVSPGDPVRLRETIRGVKVWVADPSGRWVESTMDLPDGWYALADVKK